MNSTPSSNPRSRSIRAAADAVRAARRLAAAQRGQSDARSGHALRSARWLRWSVVSVALLGAATVYAGYLWHGIALWVGAVLVWQGLQALSLWRSFGMTQRLRSARARRGEDSARR